MSCFATVFRTNDPACSTKIFRTNVPSCTMWERLFTKYVTNYDAILHPTEEDTLHIVFLISRQVVPYRTRGVTCCPGGTTPKIRSWADLSTTCHDSINYLHHSNHCLNHIIDSYTVVSHLDGWKTTHSHKDVSQTQHHKGWKTCMTLIIAWLSITNQA
jgi:hypothetical protein